MARSGTPQRGQTIGDKGRPTRTTVHTKNTGPSVIEVAAANGDEQTATGTGRFLMTTSTTLLWTSIVGTRMIDTAPTTGAAIETGIGTETGRGTEIATGTEIGIGIGIGIGQTVTGIAETRGMATVTETETEGTIEAETERSRTEIETATEIGITEMMIATAEEVTTRKLPCHRPRRIRCQTMMRSP